MSDNKVLASNVPPLYQFSRVPTYQFGPTYVAGHKMEVWDFDLLCDENYLVTGSTDNEIRLWQITHRPAFGEIDQDDELFAVSFITSLRSLSDFLNFPRHCLTL